MGDLTANFSRSEMLCRCHEWRGESCGNDTIDWQVLEWAQAIRDHFGQPVTVNSAFRCKAHNQHINGSKKSQHLRGRALDLAIEGVPPADVANYAESLIGSKGGVGRYATFTHIDSRGTGARWSG